MNHISMQNKPSHAHPDLVRALFLATPLWASGLAFLVAVFSTIKIEDHHGVKFLALALLIVGASTMAVFRVMVRDFQYRQALRTLVSRRMKLRAERMRAMRSAGKVETTNSAHA